VGKNNPTIPKYNRNTDKKRSAALGRVRAALDRAGYTRDNVRAAIGAEGHVTAQPGEVVVFERRLAGGTPLQTLIRLFLIGQTVEPADVQRAVGADVLADAEVAGLVGRTENGLRASVRVVPHGDIVIACDRSDYGGPAGEAADVVTGVTSPAILLADLTIRQHARAALDLGTGGGIQAMLLARHCERVVAVDVNPRALEFTELNVGLNGIGNIEPRLGSWFEPVAGERFDIITANPPYVMSPDSTFLYRDSGMRADGLCRQIVRDLPGHLEEGGFAHILISWALKSGEDWDAPLRRWTDGLPCDVWLLHYLTEDPLTQAAKWNQPRSAEGTGSFGAAVDRWVEYYEREGIDQIAFGAVVLRRRSGAPNWVRADSFRAGRGSSAGLVQRVFDAEDFLQGLDGDLQLLDESFGLVPEHRLEQRLRSRDGVWEQEEATLTLTQGISFTGGLDLTTARLLQQFDGRRTLREAVDACAAEMDLSAEETESLAETAMAMARRLYQLGFFVRTSR
jgi:methylase of polypeptide subunit release factors